MVRKHLRSIQHAETATIITFIVYLIFLLSIGYYFYRKTTKIDDYLLGGRGMGKWVTALSAQASDMSGWLLMGLPGAVLLGGLGETWIAIGLFFGTVVNWILVAPRLRLYTERTKSLTLPTFFEERFGDPSGFLRIFSAVVILFFFTIYASSGMAGAGKLFEVMFGLDHQIAVLIGFIVIVAYTFLGGFMAVCWTDLFQGLLMVFAIFIVPIIALSTTGGFEAVEAASAAKGISLALIPGTGFAAFLAVVSAAAWGLGYFGQPHILARFMSIKNFKELPKSTVIATVWVFISLIGAVLVGLAGITMFAEVPGGDAETVLIHMIGELFTPWFGGILLAAILSAIMSTIDSQLLVSSSALTEDFYKRIIKREASQKELLWIGRISVLVISVIAALLALRPDSTILGLVAYAWGGFGAAFGPVVLMALFSKKTSWKSALAGMITGAAVSVLWKEIGLGGHLYEIVPGFLLNFAVICIVNRFSRQKDAQIIDAFQQIRSEARDTSKHK